MKWSRRKAIALCRKYNVTDHLEDVQQEIALAYYRAMQSYDPNKGGAFSAYVNLYIEFAVQEYARLYRGSYTCGSSTAFKNLRKANAIYYRSDIAALNHQERIDAVVRETGLEVQDIEFYIFEGSNHFFTQSLDEDLIIENSDGEEECINYEIADHSADPQYLTPRLVLLDSIINEIESLKTGDRFVFMEWLGICDVCFNLIPKDKQLLKSDIANEMMLLTEGAANKRYLKIKDKILLALCDKRIITAIQVRFKEKIDIGDGLIRSVYTYKVDLDGECGIIDNIFDTVTETFWGYDLIELAEWDTMNSHMYGNMAIEMLEGNVEEKKGFVKVFSFW